MTKVYEYEGQKFEVSQIEDGGLDISKDEIIAGIFVKDKKLTAYVHPPGQAYDLGHIAEINEIYEKIDEVCEIIMHTLRYKRATEENINSKLSDFYDKLTG